MRTIAILLIAVMPVAAQVTWYVNAAAGPGGSGSQASPLNLIQPAIALAGTGDTVIVLPGTYPENLDFLGKDLLVTSSAAALTAATTIVDGGLSGSCVTFAGGEGPAAVLQGFTLTNGSGDAALGLGGGVLCDAASSPTLLDNIIVANFPGGSGGGIACVGLAAPLISGNTIDGNVAGSLGGGIYCSGDSNATITGNVVSNNDCNIHGGGIALDNWSGTITGNLIYGNSSPNSGGGIFISFSSPGISTLVGNNVISNNVANDDGGGIWSSDHDLDIVGNQLDGNVSANGAAMYLRDGTVQLTNNTVVGNPASSAGGGLYEDGGLVATVTNCIFWSNPGGQIFESVAGSVTASSSTIGGGFPGVDILTQNPMFASVANGDFHLSDQSPCISAGDPLAPALPANDLDGDPRVLYVTPDIGADEWAPPFGGNLSIDQPGGGGAVQIAIGGGGSGDVHVTLLSFDPANAGAGLGQGPWGGLFIADAEVLFQLSLGMPPFAGVLDANGDWLFAVTTPPGALTGISLHGVSHLVGAAGLTRTNVAGATFL